VLAVALVTTFVVAIVNWWTRVYPHPVIETITKPAVTVLVMWVAVAVDGPRDATVLALVALVFCLIGDIALLDAVDKFVVGLGAFLVGHLWFVAMFVALGLDRPLWGIPAAVLLVAHAVLAGRRIVAGAARQQPALRAPVSAYLFVIVGMAVVAAMTGRWWAVVGAAAFVISDTVLGWRAFVADRRWMSLTVMITYHVALVGLALSLQ